MTAGDKLLDRMRRHPQDGRIEDVVAVCRAHGVDGTALHEGSHYKVKHVSIIDILTIPAHRPIKPVYVRDLVRFIDQVVETAP